ncbi:MAG: peptidase S15, partial [Alphaproteobacteria bacterium]|nr:peptidase S15 [Alphaproteobacteria bacterium]
ARGAVKLTHRSPQSVGLCATEWLGAGVPGELPRDQREDDGRSLVFDTAPLAAPLEILGEARAELTLAVDRPVAQVIARLCDVAPDGASTRVAFGVLNLAHRDGHERPRAMTPGRKTAVVVPLPAVAYSFPVGHRIRLALSTCYWPIVWPSPEPVTLTLFAGASRLALPVRPRDPRDARLRRFAEPEQGPTDPVTPLEPKSVTRSITRDPMTGHTTVILRAEGGVLGGHRRYRIDAVGTEMAHVLSKRLDIDDDDPLSARAELVQSMHMGREGWRIAIEVSTVLTGDRESFHVEAAARSTLNGEEISARRWRSAHPRKLL